MRVLVTGATGFVGLNVVEALLARGDHVVAFDAAPLPPGGDAALLEFGGRVEVVAGDVRDLEAVARAMSGCDTLIHAAAITAGFEREQRDPHLIVDVNVKGTVNAMNAAREHEVRIIRDVLASNRSLYEHHVAKAKSDGSIPDDADLPFEGLPEIEWVCEAEK